MPRTEQRRPERRHIARTRILAIVTAAALSLGIAVGGTAVATANPTATLSTPIVNAGGVTTYDQNGLVCDSSLVGYTKPDALDGSNLSSDGTYTAAWGSISWDVSTRTVTWSIVPGWDVDVCVKGGTVLSTIDTSASAGTTYTHTYAGLSHLGFLIVSAPTATPTAPTANPVQGCGTYGSIDINDNPSVSYTVYRGSADENGSVVNLPTVNLEDAKEGVFTVVATALGDSEFAPDAVRQWEFDLGDFEVCPLGVTNASIGFIAPTCELGQQVDPAKLLVDNPDLARLDDDLSSLDGPDYTVVFVIIDDDAVFFDSDVPTPGRTVSNEGKTLTFTGTLLGSDVDDCELLPIVDPFDFIDTCVAQNFTLVFVEGLTYWVSINDDEPFAVVFGQEELDKTFTVDRGDFVSVAPVANPGYVLGLDQPAPLERQFAEYGPDECQLPDLPNWPASVTPASQVCTPLGLESGSITVQRSSGPQGNPNPVRYYLAYGTEQERELTTSVTTMAPGSYTVTAVASIDTDSINDAGNTAVFSVTVGAAADQECELTTLAFTGAPSVLEGLGAASLLLVLVGFGVMAVRRRQA